jgi:hypothetical protein
VALRRKLELFLSSRRNIAGCILGLAGIGLFAFGITSGIVGVGIVAGLYALGYLAAGPESGLRLTFFESDDSDQIRKGLERLLYTIRNRVADDVYQRVGGICYSIVQTLPTNGRANDPTDPNVNLIRQTALNYLPQALDAYLSIPRIYAERRPVAGGKTPHDILMDQLNLMDTKMREAAEDIARNDTERLLTNARFLQERFATSALEPSAVAVGAATTSGHAQDGPHIL